MRIGYVLENFSPLSEAFIRREVLALCQLDHRVFVYTNKEYYGRYVAPPSSPNLSVRELSIEGDLTNLIKAAFADGIDHLHGSLMRSAHRAAFLAAKALLVPFSLTAYSGHDIFAKIDPNLYRAAASHPLCLSIIVEDTFMREWMITQFGVALDKIDILPNSIDFDLYRPPRMRTESEKIAILSVARFVEKKGLVYLIEAFDRISAELSHIELWLVGYGPEENRLKQSAKGNDRIKFLGPMSEAQSRQVYAAANIFCLPCIQLPSGDADGIPTTILEAMAFELPVITTNILSAPCYVRDGIEGLLVPQRDVGALANALRSLSLDAARRQEMGKAGRAQIGNRCDIKVNIQRLEQIWVEGRRARMRRKAGRRAKRDFYFSLEQENYDEQRSARELNYFHPGPGKLLDIGCRFGRFRAQFDPTVEYYACEISPNGKTQKPLPRVVARPESLPFADNTFASVICNSILTDAFDMDLALSELQRVMKPAGRLYIQDRCGDPRPMDMNHLSAENLRLRVSELFEVISMRPAHEYSMMMIAGKASADRQPAQNFAEAEQASNLSEMPLSSGVSPDALPRGNTEFKLAIDGGEPVRTTFLPFGRPSLDEEEIDEVVATLRSGWIGMGPRTERFEQEFAEYIGVKYAVSVSSCTAGLFLGLMTLGIGPADEVITTALTFAATVNVIEHVGAKPVLVDIDPKTLNIDTEKIERAVTPRTRAIIPVHFGGLACDMDAINNIAERHGLAIIEDAAHAVGTSYRGRKAGALGQLASFSFYANKNLTTAEGGMVTTNDPALAERIRVLRLHGLTSDAWNRYSTRGLKKPDILLPGYKLNLTDLGSAIGIHQLRKQESFLETRQRYARLYDEAFASLPVRTQPRNSDFKGDRHSLHLYLLVLEAGRWRTHRDNIIEALLRENIGAALHYQPIHMLRFYQEKYGYSPADYPHAYDIGEHVLSLPLSPSMSEADARDVVIAVQRVATAYAQ